MEGGAGNVRAGKGEMAMSDEKICPACAETVKAAAARCRFCGHDFSGRSAMGAPRRRGGGFSCLGAAVAIVLGLALLSKCGSDLIEQEDARTEKLVAPDAMPGLKVTARELFRAYQDNEAAAQAQYGERILDVSGTVESVDLDLTDDPVVRLETDNQFMSAMVDLIDSEKPKAASLNKGQVIVVRCTEIREIVGSPSLRHCAIIG